MGKSGWVEARPVKKWSFQVWMALSAGLFRCICGVTSWRVMFLFSTAALNSPENSLSKMKRLGLNPPLTNFFIRDSQASTISAAVRFFNGTPQMTFES